VLGKKGKGGDEWKSVIRSDGEGETPGGGGGASSAEGRDGATFPKQDGKHEAEPLMTKIIEEKSARKGLMC